MTEITVKIDQLKQSVSNVRSKHSKEDIDMMTKSITYRGIIHPPAVAKNGDGSYEVVAGFLRVLGATKAGIKEIRCLDVSAFTPSERVELSLSENVDRRNMTAMQYYAAFNKLFKAGMPVAKIGERFNKTEREVQQLLAIGSLPKKILDWADDDQIGDRTLEALAIANGKDVVRYCKLSAKDRPRDWEIQKWLAGEKGMFMEKFAIFDLDKYVGPKITDLFAPEDEVWITDGEQFWILQHTAILAKIKEYADKHYVVEQVEHFQSWAYERVSKKKGGKVIWSKSERTGEVQFYVGYKRIGKAGTAPKAKGSDGKPQAKPEISQAFNDFMAETRHAAVQRHMIDNKGSGLVATLILLLKQCDNVMFRSGGKALSDAYGDSLHSSDNSIVVHDDYTEMLTTLGLKNGHTWDAKIAKLGPALMEYSQSTLISWIVLTIAYQWDCEGKSGDEIGKVIGLTQVNAWEADTAFWDGIKNKATLIKIAKDNKIAINDKATTKVIRAIVSNKMPDSWRPSWLKF